MKKNKTQQHAATQGTQHQGKQNTSTRKQKVDGLISLTRHWNCTINATDMV